MTTLTSFATACATALGDSGNSIWSAATIKTWIHAAIRGYSQFFPRILTISINAATDDRQYDLPAGLLSIISVEYPVGQDPVEYLARRTHLDAAFWQLSGYYDILFHHDTSDVAELIISEKPTTGETISVIYEALHDDSLADDDTITVPVEHEHLLLAYVRYMAYNERAAYWATYSGETSAGPWRERFEQARAFTALAEAAWREYTQGIESARRPLPTAGTVVWRADSYDPIY